MKMLPTRLYKYRPFYSDFQQEIVEQIIKEHRLFFAPVNAFFDPFEFRVLRQALSTTNLRMPDASERILDNDLGYLSLSETCDNMLMWSFYADWHRGLCMGFEIMANCNFFSRVSKVSYTSKYPSTSTLSANSRARVIKASLSKSVDWSHEKEWRIIESGLAGVSCQYPAIRLKEVILGIHFPTEQVQVIQNWINSYDHEIELLKTEVDVEHYTLRVRHYNPSLKPTKERG